MAKANFARIEFQNSLVISPVHMDNQPTTEDNSVWKAPACLKFKANCDVAIRPNSSEGMVAVVLRDWKGNMVDGLSKSVHISSSLHGELFCNQGSSVFWLLLWVFKVSRWNQTTKISSFSSSVGFQRLTSF